MKIQHESPRYFFLMVIAIGNFQPCLGKLKLHVWNSHRQHAARLFQTIRRTIGSFTAIAGLLVHIDCGSACMRTL